ncbi:MAG: DUF92 domain-containing protein [Gemmatimonadetes bacterium]|nr:DUF92 domain-containing protein [Gemmatimonadota bacterium]
MSAWLSPRGTLAALAVGAAVATGTGWRGLAVLGVFFVSSSLLTPGGGRREPIQVAANGGIAAAAALLSLARVEWQLVFAGALAAAAADTWSTEIGGRSDVAPRLITTGAPVPPGTSGGVTLLGSLASVLGAALVATTATVLEIAPLGAAPWIVAGGVAGGLADSVLGATLQARYRCAACGALGERPSHGCGGTGVLEGGMRWITNDTVNLLATAVGAAVASAPVALQRAPLG